MNVRRKNWIMTCSIVSLIQTLMNFQGFNSYIYTCRVNWHLLHLLFIWLFPHNTLAYRKHSIFLCLVQNLFALEILLKDPRRNTNISLPTDRKMLNIILFSFPSCPPKAMLVCDNWYQCHLLRTCKSLEIIPTKDVWTVCVSCIVCHPITSAGEREREENIRVTITNIE